MSAKKKVLFIGTVVKATDKIWDGSVATTYNVIESLKLSQRYDILHYAHNSFKKPEDVQALINETGADLLHIDSTRGAELVFKAGVQPDVIGPVSRAPNGVKVYKQDNEIWQSIYTQDWFYKAVVIRLNGNEERHPDFADKYHLVSQGVDTRALMPTHNAKAKYILWAGDAKRYAKNYALMEDIMAITTLPAPYEFKVMSGYNVEDYWKVLDDTALLINTSRYESFCAALFEAKAKGITTIYPERLHNDRFLDGQIQVPYNAQEFSDKILELLNDTQLLAHSGALSRQYCVDHASFDVMCQSYEDAYDQALARKNG